MALQMKQAFALHITNGMPFDGAQRVAAAKEPLDVIKLALGVHRCDFVPPAFVHVMGVFHEF